MTRQEAEVRLEKAILLGRDSAKGMCIDPDLAESTMRSDLSVEQCDGGYTVRVNKERLINRGLAAGLLMERLERDAHEYQQRLDKL